MELKIFADHEMGYSHVKNGTLCEDYAASYEDASGRFFICVACDGHSDNNCFRSAKGAKFGCESAVEVLRNFFELLHADDIQETVIDKLAEDRLKKSIKQLWDCKVMDDIDKNPITDEELRPLTEKVRNYYQAGKGLLNIYGATFLAVAISDDYCIALHIGDGVMLLVNTDGTYYDPLPIDEKSDMGSPASLCDNDLFTRKNAFRSIISNSIPIAAVVSSDGIGDSMDQYQFMERIHGLVTKFSELEDGAEFSHKFNAKQEAYLKSFVEYYTKMGNGVEDDCSLAGIYNGYEVMPPVKLPLEVAEQMLSEAIHERDAVVEDYEKRKQENLLNLRELNNKREFRTSHEIIECIEKIESIKDVLRNIEKNEAEKISFYDEKIRMSSEYVVRAGGLSKNRGKMIPVNPLDSIEVEPEEGYRAYKSGKEEYDSILKRAKEVQSKKSELRGKNFEVYRRLEASTNKEDKKNAELEMDGLEEAIQQLSREYSDIETEIESAKKKVEFAERCLIDQWNDKHRTLQRTQQQQRTQIQLEAVPRQTRPQSQQPPQPEPRNQKWPFKVWEKINEWTEIKPS